MLSAFQEAVITYLAHELNDISRRLNNGEIVRDQTEIVAGYACALHADLVANGARIQFPDVFFHKDGPEPSDPEFFWNFSAVGELMQWGNILATKRQKYFASWAK